MHISKSGRRLARPVLFLLLAAVFALMLSLPASAAINPIEPLLPDSPVSDEGEAIDPDRPGGGTGTNDPNLNISVNGESSDAVNILLLLTILTVLPSILLMMTCFTRIIIVFSLMRNAMGIQQTPPNQVLVGLALFLTFFIMRPVILDINENAYKPFSENEINAEEFVERAYVPLRDFMFKQTTPQDLNTFLNLAEMDRPERVEDYPMTVMVPSFITSEIKRGFTIGFLIYIPFLIIDMVVGSALMSMGMMMLPPVTVSMPFKLMLFVMVDGWGLLIKALVSTYT